MLLFGQAIQTAGTVKGRGLTSTLSRTGWRWKAAWDLHHYVCDAVSVYDCLVNLLDTPGTKTSRRYPMVPDGGGLLPDGYRRRKGVEDRTLKLMEVTRSRYAVILTTMNELDRDIRDPMELLDEVENELKIGCAPITWPDWLRRLFKAFTTFIRMKPISIRAVKATPFRKSALLKG